MLSLCLGACLVCAPGCSMISRFGSDPVGEDRGKTFYLGGAGPIGRVGSFDVPHGLRDGGYRGAIEVFDWQSLTLVDQMVRERNKGQALQLAHAIQKYMDQYPGRRVNLIALSAGTGIAIWALEQLPEKYRVGTVVFLGSSLSRRYDLSLALHQIDGKLYNFYSPDDPILRYGVPLSGTVDREFEGTRVAGLLGFAPPPTVSRNAPLLYDERLQNMPWRKAYGKYGYTGRHTDSVRRDFIARYIAPLMTEPVRPPTAARPGDPQPRRATEPLEIPTSEPEDLETEDSSLLEEPERPRMNQEAACRS